MPLLIAGIDEAGYGPTLGPLCVGMTLFRVRDWKPGDPAPDLWKLLSRGICRKPGDKRKRVAVADSKQLKLPNDTTTRHPLVYLERGVLGFLRGLAHEPATDADLFARLGVGLEGRPWYAGTATALPLALGAGELAIAASRIAGALDVAGIELVDVRCVVIAETEFNGIIRETGSKGEATATALGRHLRHIVEVWGSEGEREQAPELTPEGSCPGSEIPDLKSQISDLKSEITESGAEVSGVAAEAAAAAELVGAVDEMAAGTGPALRVICDQLGGRTQYEELLARELGMAVTPLSESGERSRYAVGEGGVVQFMPEAESAHLPVALASMVAKFTRELAMMRFNRYWCARCPELKPTAGYSTDARRWLMDAAGVLTPEERAAMVRIA